MVIIWTHDSNTRSDEEWHGSDDLHKRYPIIRTNVSVASGGDSRSHMSPTASNTVLLNSRVDNDIASTTFSIADDNFRSNNNNNNNSSDNLDKKIDEDRQIHVVDVHQVVNIGNNNHYRYERERIAFRKFRGLKTVLNNDGNCDQPSAFTFTESISNNNNNNRVSHSSGSKFTFKMPSNKKSVLTHRHTL